MGQVTITLNGRTYRLSCSDGEETRLIKLADELKARVESIIAEFGHAGDDRLLLMAALLALDELFDLKDRLAALVPVELPPALVEEGAGPAAAFADGGYVGSYVGAPAGAVPTHGVLPAGPPAHGAPLPEPAPGAAAAGHRARHRAR